MHTWFVVTASGIEGIAGDELRRLGFAPRVEPGRCFFEGSASDAFRSALWLRAADRLMLRVGGFEATGFAALFEQTHDLPWHKILPADAAVAVRGSCVRSTLMSLPDCQRIVKRAIATRMTGSSDGRMPETGDRYDIDVHIHRDAVLIGLDASGPLHKRGYRQGLHEAPLRETLAAALILGTPWRKGQALWDPMCGSGTIVIEAAMIAGNLPPNLSRSFSMEKWPMSRDCAPEALRLEALEHAEIARLGSIFGSDTDPAAIELARENARRAGVGSSVGLQVGAAQGSEHPAQSGWMITNPPYGMRLGDVCESQAAAAVLGGLLRPEWGLCALTPDASFERAAGRKAARNRRFYNGRIECRALIFPPRDHPSGSPFPSDAHRPAGK